MAGWVAENGASRRLTSGVLVVAEGPCLGACDEGPALTLVVVVVRAYGA